MPVRKINPLPEHWAVSHEFNWNGRHIQAGTELSIKGVSGRFRFIKYVNTGSAKWVDVVGGRKGVTTFRSFRPERIKTVHRVNKTRENAKKS
jgi:hypothetical protein